MSKYIVGVGFDSPKLSYYEIETDVNVGQEVVVETSLGFELGKIQIVKNYKESDEGLFPHVLRLATFQDKSTHAKNIEKGKIVGKSVQELSNSMQLNMNVIQAMFSLDNTKVLITYTSDDRVDFRELLKVLSGQLKCRIELRQIGPRDKAGIVGGLGVCGLKLCCSSFLDTFDGISISMAKNQMLSLNIPKLSGHCGKLMCCLKYEDQAYSELKTKYPPIGSRVIYNNKQYTITGLNVISGNLTISDGEGLTIVSSKQVKVIGSGKDKDVKKK